jgi:hypothetical protein
MNKSVTICFRTSEGLRNELETIAKEERRSISSTIETILYKFTEDRGKEKRLRDEKRRYPRKAVSMPALIRRNGADEKTLQAGIILDVSLGGLQISIPNYYHYDIRKDGETSRISIVFTLPDGKIPLTMHCVPKRVQPSDSETRVGLSFVDTDFASHQALQNYLVH